MTCQITLVYLRTYSDTGQKVLYVEWSDGSRTSCEAERATKSTHMQALLARAQREGIILETESWSDDCRK
jgi:hypothetical protein